MRSIAAAVVMLFSTGCVKELTSDERLERELTAPPAGQSISKEDLQKLNCENTPAELAKARNENRPETDRLMAYVELYESLKKKVATFEEAMTRNPDLHYQEGSEAIVGARDTCIQQVADVKVEFETYVRELVSVPTVQEIKGGSTVTVARLDFNTLRQAIESLGPDDKDALLSRVNNAEKKVGAYAGPREASSESGSSSTTSTTSSSSRRRRRGSSSSNE